MYSSSYLRNLIKLFTEQTAQLRNAIVFGTEATGPSIGTEGGHSLGFGGNGVLGIKVSIEEKEHALARAQGILYQSGILQPVSNDAHKDICGLGIVNRKKELAGESSILLIKAAHGFTGGRLPPSRPASQLFLKQYIKLV